MLGLSALSGRVIATIAAVLRASPVGHFARLRAPLGVLCGITAMGFSSRLVLGDLATVPLMIAPMGASAFLLFVVPSSPFSQPWSAIGGSLVSGLAGVLAARMVPDLVMAGALAVALAVIAMAALRCLHPPGGAVALTAVVGGPVIHALGWTFLLAPVALNIGVLTATAWLFHKITGHGYPHRPRIDPKVAAPDTNIGHTRSDIDAILAHYDALLDVSREDLHILFSQVEDRAQRRLHAMLTCGHFMTRDIPRADPLETGRAALDRMAEQPGTARWIAMPVVSADGRLVGSIETAMLVAYPDAVVEAMMEPAPAIASPDTPIDAVLPVLAGGQFQHVMVTNASGRFLGMVTQTDLLAALWRGHVAEQLAATE